MADDMELQAEEAYVADTAAQDSSPEPVESKPEPEHKDVGSAIREAYERAKAKAAGEEERPKTFRGDKGKFAKEPSAEGLKETEPKEARSEPEKPVAPEPEKQAAPQTPVTRKAPVGWSAQARLDYAKLPEHIQDAVARREEEINNGFKILSDYKGMEEHLPVIKASGLTAAQFTANAVAWERSLKERPVDTVLHAARLGNVNMVELSKAILQNAGINTQGVNPSNAQIGRQAQQPDFQKLVAAEIEKREQASKQANAQKEAEAFLADPANTHAEALIDDMVALINQGRAANLKEAYEKAMWANPDTRDLLIKERMAKPQQARAQVNQQARAAAKATVGAPNGPQNPTKANEPKTVRDAIRAAYAQQLENA